MSGLKEFAIALARIVLGLIITIEGIIALGFLHYASTVSGFYSDKIAAAYEDSYDNGYTQTYNVGYQEAYPEAYDRGYEKGHEIGLETSDKIGLTQMTVLTNPTRKEMREFLAHDKTNDNSFIINEYVCSDFSAELKNNAEANGIRAAYVRIRSTEWRHAVVAFETTDRGLIFIEPQSDREVELVTGKSFPWYMVGAVSALRSIDPITEIQIIW